MIGLLRFLREHREAIEVDFLRHYQLDPAEHLGGERLTYRRCRALIRALPDDSATKQATAGADGVWTRDQMLLATLVDRVGYGNYLALQRWFKGSHRPPEPVQRPGVAKPAEALGKGRGMSVEELRFRLRRPRRPAPRRSEVTRG